MTRRKLKPGPKRRVGRPASAQRREAESKRLKGEREILAEMGYQYVTVVVADEYAAFLKEDSSVNRIKGLLGHAEKVGDAEKARVLSAKLEIALVKRANAIAERSARKAKADLLVRKEAARRAQAEAAAQRLAEGRHAPSDGNTHPEPVEVQQAMSEAELVAAMKRGQSHLL